jgi:pimeloyl-ACP methyl ester carboxylesterase
MRNGIIITAGNGLIVLAKRREGRMKKWAIWIAAGLSYLIPIPMLAQSSFPLAASSPEHNWQFTEVGGNRIAWSCKGQGKPTIVFIAGWGLSARNSFGRIFQNYDGPGRLCMYDRAGIGESTFANPKTRTLDQLADELHDLSHANNWGNVVLVPHSFAGFIARGYAQKYPNEVLGILFLDVSHEDYVPRLKAEMSPKDWAIMQRLIEWSTRTFHEDYLQAQEAVRNTKLPPDLPITVLTRGVPYTNVRLSGFSDDAMDLYEYEHRALQAKVAALSNNSEHRIARYSSHIFNDSDPQIVIDEIKNLLKRLKK